MRLHDSEITQLLEVLDSEYPGYRLSAVQRLAKLAVKDTDVVRALEAVAAGDSNAQVREAALRALGRAKPRGHVYRTRTEKWLDFALGFVGWWLINTGSFWVVAVAILGTLREFGVAFAMPTLFILNVVALIVLGKKHKWAVLGILSAYAVNFVIMTIMGVFMAGACGMPAPILLMPSS